MTTPHQISKIGVTKLVLLVLIFCLFTYIIFFSKPIINQSNTDASTQKAIVSSLDKGSQELRESKELLKKSGIYGKHTTLADEIPSAKKVDEKPVMCPQYILPKLPELPKLPPKEVMDTVTKDQLNLILYQHIKTHQERTIEVRKRIFISYAEYLKYCE